MDVRKLGRLGLTLNLLTTTIVAPSSNASKWQMGFNSAFKGSIALKHSFVIISGASTACVIQCQHTEGPKVWHFA